MTTPNSDHRLRTFAREAAASGDYFAYAKALEGVIGIGPEKEDLAPLQTRPITEEDGEQKEWYLRARDVESVDAFIVELAGYEHDYGTICHAVAAVAIAAAYRMNATDQGGITGFQAGAIMWEFIKHWNHVEGHARLLKFGDMLYPQYGERFASVMGESVWTWLQKKAKENLAEKEGSGNVHAHWQTIADGFVPFGWVVRGE